MRWVPRKDPGLACPRGHAASWRQSSRGRVCVVCNRERQAEFRERKRHAAHVELKARCLEYLAERGGGNSWGRCGAVVL